MTEEGLTNLGPVPRGMTFFAATEASALSRQYKINPKHHSQRLTLCETLREIYRIADRLAEPERSKLQLLAAAAFDYGKRMDARMKQLKAVHPHG